MSEPQQIAVNADLRRVAEIVHVALRRVSAFLKITLETKDHPIPENFSLAGEMYEFWPNPVPQSAKDQALETYVLWVSGCCLRELDLHFAMFLDSIWRLADLADIHGKIVKAGYALDERFERDTNVRSKLDKLASRLDIEVWSECFGSLSRARNALTHGPGKVRAGDCDNGSNELRVRWKAAEFHLFDGEEQIRLDAPNALPYQTKSDAKVMLHLTEHSVVFAKGELINLSERQLAEICLCYHQQAGLIIKSLEDYVVRRGVPLKRE